MFSIMAIQRIGVTHFTVESDSTATFNCSRLAPLITTPVVCNRHRRTINRFKEDLIQRKAKKSQTSQLLSQITNPILITVNLWQSS